jgi:hypothetical protein
MARDPSKVGRARVSAELIAEVVNGFVEPISWKTLVSGMLFFITTIVTHNVVSGRRSRYHH